jgi:hypothetical protein
MKNSSRIVSVIFEVKTESERLRFNVPKNVTKFLGLKSKDEIALVIRRADSGKPLYGGTHIGLSTLPRLCSSRSVSFLGDGFRRPNQRPILNAILNGRF